MIKSIAKKITLFLQRLGLIVALIIIGMVIIIFLGRQTISQIDQIRPSIQSYIASNTGLEVNLGSLSGEWPRLFPIIDVEGIEFIDSQQDRLLSLENVRANLDVFSSILFDAPIWRELAIEKLEINFVEDASGHWRLKGFSSESEADLNIILKPFLYSRQIKLESLTVNLHSFSGQKIQLFGNKMLIENDDDFHRAQLLISANEVDSPAQFIIEANGDLSDLESFSANGYLKFEELNFSESLKMFSRSLIPNLALDLSKYPIKIDGEIWLDFSSRKRLDYKGQLSLSNVPLNWIVEDALPVSDIRTKLTGWYQPGQDWGADLQNFQFDLGSEAIEPIDLLFTQKLGSNWQEFDISINHINLELVSELIFESQLLSADAISALKIADPNGNLSSLSMGKSENGFYLLANLDGCYMHPFRGIPGFKDLHGYIELKESSALLHIADNDGFEIFFPKSYRDYLTIKKAQGTIYFDWQSPSQRIVFSDIVNTQLESGDSQLKFTIELPPEGEQRAADLNLLIGARDLDLSLMEKYIPHTMPKKSSKWARDAIKRGNLKQFGLLFRGGPPKSNRLSRTMQLLFETEDASIKFDPNWPQLDKVEGLFMFDSGDLSAQIELADFDRATVNKARIEYSAKAPIEQRMWIINGQLEADLLAMIDILNKSPLSQNLGPMTNWDYSGDTTTEVYLEMPSNIADRDNPPKTSYRITSLIENGELAISESPIILNKLAGEIEFSSKRGIYSNNLSALLWDKPFNAKLYRDNQQRLSFTTALNPKSLNKFAQFPWQEILSNNITINGSLAKDPNNPSKTILGIESDMQAVAINLPQPIGKKAGQLQSLTLKLHFDPSFSRLEGMLGKNLLSNIQFDHNGVRRGAISYDHDLVMPDQGMLLISANLPAIDFKQWKPLINLMDETPNRSNTIEPVFDLELDHWKVSGIQLSQISARIKPVAEGFDAVFTSDLADGAVSIFRNPTKPPKVSLNRLDMKKPLGSNSVNLDPRLLMAADFSVDRLSISERELGSISFELRPEPSGVSFNNILGTIFGLQPGIYAREAPTEFFWGYDGKEHISKLVGPIGINNLGDVFNEFSMPQVLDSQSGKLNTNLSWQAEPWGISKDNLKGELKISLSEGNFYRTSGGAGAALKLVGLFNFANWLKRLQLDFSDVLGDNLAYDKLDGIISFDRSILSLREPLKIKMPSGKITMAGDFNLGLETIDAKLVATLPVATNLPWLAGLTGGMPAALGVYATSKLVEKQVDRLSSISYEVKGSWDDVEVSVDKIFAAELKESIK